VDDSDLQGFDQLGRDGPCGTVEHQRLAEGVLSLTYRYRLGRFGVD